MHVREKWVDFQDRTLWDVTCAPVSQELHEQVSFKVWFKRDLGRKSGAAFCQIRNSKQLDFVCFERYVLQARDVRISTSLQEARLVLSRSW